MALVYRSASIRKLSANLFEGGCADDEADLVNDDVSTAAHSECSEDEHDHEPLLISLPWARKDLGKRAASSAAVAAPADVAPEATMQEVEQECLFGKHDVIAVARDGTAYFIPAEHPPPLDALRRQREVIAVARDGTAHLVLCPQWEEEEEEAEEDVSFPWEEEEEDEPLVVVSSSGAAYYLPLSSQLNWEDMSWATARRPASSNVEVRHHSEPEAAMVSVAEAFSPSRPSISGRAAPVPRPSRPWSPPESVPKRPSLRRIAANFFEPQPCAAPLADLQQEALPLPTGPPRRLSPGCVPEEPAVERLSLDPSPRGSVPRPPSLRRLAALLFGA